MVQAQLDFFVKITNVLGGHWRPSQILDQSFYELAKYWGQNNALVNLLEVNGASATEFFVFIYVFLLEAIRCKFYYRNFLFSKVYLPNNDFLNLKLTEFHVLWWNIYVPMKINK